MFEVFFEKVNTAQAHFKVSGFHEFILKCEYNDTNLFPDEEVFYTIIDPCFQYSTTEIDLVDMDFETIVDKLSLFKKSSGNLLEDLLNIREVVSPFLGVAFALSKIELHERDIDDLNLFVIEKKFLKNFPEIVIDDRGDRFTLTDEWAVKQGLKPQVDQNF